MIGKRYVRASERQNAHISPKKDPRSNHKRDGSLKASKRLFSPAFGSIIMESMIPLERLPGVEYQERKSILNTSKIEWVERCCNHYLGCVHGCTYPCYARLISRKSPEAWSEVKVASNALEIIEKEIPLLKKRGHGEDEILLSSMSDPYQQIEAFQLLTNRILKVLIREDMRFKILTKSELVSRDYELISKANHGRVGFTLITLDDNQRMIWEPLAGRIHQRTQALLDAKYNFELTTFVSMEPIILGVTKPLEIIEELADVVDFWIFGKHNYAPMNMQHHYIPIREKIINKCKELGLNYLIKAELKEEQAKFKDYAFSW